LVEWRIDTAWGATHMARARILDAGIGVIGLTVVLGAMSVASAVFAPVAFALFLIALLWPLQKRLQTSMPRLPALAASILVLIATFVAFASLIAWGFGRVARWVIANMGRFQILYDQTAAWLEEQGIAVATLWADHFNTGWLLGLMQKLTNQVNTTLSFWVVVLIYVILGLLEVDGTAQKIGTLPNRTAVRVLVGGSAQTAARIRRYMAVRTLMSVLTGALVWIFAVAFGLPLAREWGVIAFALNYIPFIGPFVATLFPTLLAMVEFESWKAVLAVFAGLNVIQSIVGSYVEPRLSGTALSMSPFVVLFSIFLWTFLWGLSGTFIGVPITVAVLTFCAQHPDTRWLAVLLGSPNGKGTDVTDPAFQPEDRTRR
jgi:AI-2 transport protein TqsA